MDAFAPEQVEQAIKETFSQLANIARANMPLGVLPGQVHVVSDTIYLKVNRTFKVDSEARIVVSLVGLKDDQLYTFRSLQNNHIVLHTSISFSGCQRNIKESLDYLSLNQQILNLAVALENMFFDVLQSNLVKMEVGTWIGKI